MDQVDLEEGEKEVITGEKCMFCDADQLTLSETIVEIPYFGLTHILSMNCGNCGYKKSDVEAEEDKDGVKYKIEVDSEDDLNIRVVKSANAKVKFHYIGDMEPGEAANGFITNIEGLLNKFKEVLEDMKEASDDKEKRDKLKNKIKKINRCIWGRDSITISIEDPTGNSTIVSEKAEKEKL